MKRPPSRKMPAPAPSRILITGGAGFIGTNLAHRLAASQWRVVIYDNLSRPGVERNLRWLQSLHGDRLELLAVDIRDTAALGAAVRAASHVFHLAAQVAVTTSLDDPHADFMTNASGTLGLLEAVRTAPQPPSLVFTSTNKVYGGLDGVEVTGEATRYVARTPGIDEKQPLDFHSPYGCSKGAADQYVLDYARSFGIRALVFRMSCIYGPHQCGTEDQGWVAHFLMRALSGRPLTIYGDGRQVRDILYVDDLVDALLLAQQNVEKLRGEAFNIGGGSANSVSLVELMARIAELHARPLNVSYGDWRTGDQRFYVSDHGKFTRATGWRPRVPAPEGVARLYAWLKNNVAQPAARESTTAIIPAEPQTAAAAS
jgi:CDP-paratose 2-epimerase